MEKYNGSFTNRAGRAISGATVTVYTGGALATIYDDDETTTLANPLTTTADGTFGFRGANAEYTLSINHSSLSAPVSVTGIVLNDGSESPSSDAAIRSTADNKGAGLVGFLYASTYAASTVGKWLQDLALSTGASFIGWIQSGTSAVLRTVTDKLRETVHAKDFGALGDGSTNDNAAILAAANSLTYGGTVILTRGTYNATGLTLPDGVSLEGDGTYATTLRTTNATGNFITAGSATMISKMKLSSTVTRTSGYHVDIQKNGVTLRNVDLDSYYIGLNVGTIGGTQAVAPVIDRCQFRSPAVTAGSGAVQFMNYSNAVVSNCVGSGPALPGTQPTFGIRFQNGDTAFISNTNFTLHGKSLLVDTPAGYNNYALSIANSLFDSAGTIAGGSSVSSAEIIPAGNVYDVKIANTWFGLSQSKFGLYVAPSGAGVVDGLSISNPAFVDNGDSGFIAVGTGVTNWSVNGGYSSSNADAGVRAASGTTKFSITNHRAGNIAGRGANNYGIKIGGAADNYVITGNNLIGNTTAAMDESGTGTTKTITNNLGHNPVAQTSITVTASPFSWTNNMGYPVIVMVSGGTVSAISVDGKTVASATDRQAVVPHGKSLGVVYTVAPTAVYVGM